MESDMMNREETLHKKMSKVAQVARFIKRNLPQWKVVETIPDRVHGGIVRYTEANPSEQHDPKNEPHQISLPSSPAVKWKAWLKQQLAPALDKNATGVGVEGQMRSRYRNQGGYKLASDNKENKTWFSVLKVEKENWESSEGSRGEPTQDFPDDDKFWDSVAETDEEEEKRTREAELVEENKRIDRENRGE
tara:strand:+ start:1121 stop:1693 length:573 start_codon:yes stop_codon:yes gene_type:complete